MRWYEIVFGVVVVVLWYAWPILADDLAALLARAARLAPARRPPPGPIGAPATTMPNDDDKPGGFGPAAGWFRSRYRPPILTQVPV